MGFPVLVRWHLYIESFPWSMFYLYFTICYTGNTIDSRYIALKFNMITMKSNSREAKTSFQLWTHARHLIAMVHLFWVIWRKDTTRYQECTVLYFTGLYHNKIDLLLVIQSCGFSGGLHFFMLWQNNSSLLLYWHHSAATDWPLVATYSLIPAPWCSSCK